MRAKQPTRPLRAGERLRHALAEVLGRTEWRDPDLAGLTISVTEARLSPDLSHATVFVMPLLGRGSDKAAEALNRNKSYIKRQAAPLLGMKTMPDLKFEADTSFDNARRIEELLEGERK